MCELKIFKSLSPAAFANDKIPKRSRSAKKVMER
jgi:hypothetical protein